MLGVVLGNLFTTTKCFIWGCCPLNFLFNSDVFFSHFAYTFFSFCLDHVQFDCLFKRRLQSLEQFRRRLLSIKIFRGCLSNTIPLLWHVEYDRGMNKPSIHIPIHSWYSCGWVGSPNLGPREGSVDWSRN